MRRENPPDEFESLMRRNVGVYYVYSAIREAHIWVFFVVWVVFLRDVRGLSLAQIGIIDASFWVSMALAEVPTGVVADRIGRKASLLIGALLEIVGLLVFVLSGRFIELLTANVIMGVAFTFHSGAGTALLYESLQAIGDAQTYTTVAGRVRAISQTATIVAGLAGSAIVAVGLIYPFVVGCGLAVLTFLVILLIREPPQEGKETEAIDTETEPHSSYGSIVTGAMRLLRSERVALAVLIYMAVAGAISYLVMLFIQPLVANIVSSSSIVAIAVVTINAGGIGGSLLAGKVMVDERGRLILLLAPVIVGVLMFIVWSGNMLALVLIPCVVTAFLFSLIMPELASLLNRRTPRAIRATVFSIQSVVMTALLAIATPTAGRVVDLLGPSFAFVCIGALAIGYSIYHLRRFSHDYAMGLNT
jgi:predicted MFS family arabinose efflux permease